MNVKSECKKDNGGGCRWAGGPRHNGGPDDFFVCERVQGHAGWHDPAPARMSLRDALRTLDGFEYVGRVRGRK